jgi:O-antigen/teichoic acid export membrane protein
VRGLELSATARDTVINAAGTGLTALFSFACLMVAARALGPAGYGLFALALTVLMMAAELSDLGVNAGIIRHASAHLGAGDAAAARAVLAAALRAKLVTAAIGALTVVALAGPLAGLLGRPAAAGLLRLAAFGLAGTVLLGAFSAALQAHQSFLRNAALSVSNWALRLVGTAALAASGKISPASLLLCFAVTPWLMCGVGGLLAPRGALGLTPWDPRRAREVLDFSRWMAIWGLFTLLLNRLDLLLVGGLTDDVQAGYYGAAQRVAMLVTMSVNAYLMALVPRLSRLRSRVEIARMTAGARRVVAVGSIGIAALAAAAPWVIQAFGTAFRPAAPALTLLLAGTILQAWTLPWNAALYALDRPQVFALASGLALVAATTLNLALIPRLGALGAGAGSLAAGAVQLTIAVRFGRRAIDPGLA